MRGFAWRHVDLHNSATFYPSASLISPEEEPLSLITHDIEDGVGILSLES